MMHDDIEIEDIATALKARGINSLAQFDAWLVANQRELGITTMAAPTACTESPWQAVLDKIRAAQRQRKGAT